MYTSLPHNSENGNSVLITLAGERETNSCLFPADGMLLRLLITLTYTHQLPGAPSHLHQAPAAEEVRDQRRNRTKSGLDKVGVAWGVAWGQGAREGRL